jgi:sulfur-oxidizing protein SoxX
MKAGAAAWCRRSHHPTMLTTSLPVPCFIRHTGHSAVLAVALAGLLVASPVSADGTIKPYVVVGDGIPEPLTTTPGDPARGKAVVTNRQVGLCLLCHSGPFPEEKFQGDLAPSLAGAGNRLSIPQLRLRIVDGSRLNPDTIMPAYYKTEGLQRVAPAFVGKTVLTAQQIEDVVAFLATLKDEKR